MTASADYRVQYCVAAAIIICVVLLYIARTSQRFRQFRGYDKFAGLQPQTAQKPLCSFDLFRSIARSRLDGFVSGNGTWKRSRKGLPVYFQPDICRFNRSVFIPRREVIECIKHHRLHYIVFAGDSNALRSFSALKSLLNGIGAECLPYKVDRSRNHAVDPGYYRPIARDSGGGALYVHERDCSGCINRKMACRSTSANISIIIEMLALEFTIDAEVTSFETYKNCMEYLMHNVKPCRVTTTTQQFIFKEYLATTPPDLFVLFGNSHDSSRYTLREHAMNVRTLADMISIYLPLSTKFIWTSKPAEYPPNKPDFFRGRIYENRTMDITEWLIAANRIHYHELKKLFVEKGRPLMFLDLFGISTPVLRDWNVDGVHMKRVWYRHIVSHIMQSLCVV